MMFRSRLRLYCGGLSWADELESVNRCLRVGAEESIIGII